MNKSIHWENRKQFVKKIFSLQGLVNYTKSEFWQKCRTQSKSTLFQSRGIKN